MWYVIFLLRFKLALVLKPLPAQAVHRDPFGSKPRSTLFANEGLRTIDVKLTGSECMYLNSPNTPTR